MYTIKPTTKFQKDLKRIKKRGYDISLLTDVIKKLASGEVLPAKNKDHFLIGAYAFYGNENLQSVVIPTSVTDIGVCSFAHTNIKSISIPPEVTVIKDGTFDSCIYLNRVDFPNGLKVIGKFAFASCCSLLPNEFSLPASVKDISPRAFLGCSSEIRGKA